MTVKLAIAVGRPSSVFGPLLTSPFQTSANGVFRAPCRCPGTCERRTADTDRKLRTARMMSMPLKFFRSVLFKDRRVLHRILIRSRRAVDIARVLRSRASADTDDNLRSCRRESPRGATTLRGPLHESRTRSLRRALLKLRPRLRSSGVQFSQRLLRKVKSAGR